MIDLPLLEVAQVLKAELNADPDLLANSLPPVSIDSRTISQGQCFIAIRGPRFDGHDFVEDALHKGASLTIHCRALPGASHWKDRLFLRVEDTTAALQALAHHVRKKWGKSLVAVSGSMGKTTTKEFIATLLDSRFNVFRSPGNLNNEIGVPLSLLQLSQENELAVVELGMNHPGEIRVLSQICRPDSAVLTNVAAVHLEFFSDLREIAAAKGEVLEFLPEDGCLFFNADDPLLAEQASRYSGRKVPFSLNNPAPVRVVNYRFDHLQRMMFEIDAEGRRISGTLPFAGTHILYNVAAAVAVAVTRGLTAEEIQRAFSKLDIPSMRGQISHLPAGSDNPITIWDDSYNSNPQALAVVLDTVLQLSDYSRKILALGEMLELGSESDHFHEEAGRHAAQCNVDLLVTVGEGANMMIQGAKQGGLSCQNMAHFRGSDEAAEFLSTEVRPGDFLLVKGSRGVRMERIVQTIKEKTRN